MGTQEFTSGPWYVAKTGNHQGLVVAEQTGANICVTYDKKDALLISAAPELLKALKDLVESIEAEEDFSFEHGMDCDGGEQCAFCSAKNAIAQVEEDYISGPETEGGAA